MPTDTRPPRPRGSAGIAGPSNGPNTTCMSCFWQIYAVDQPPDQPLLRAPSVRFALASRPPRVARPTQGATPRLFFVTQWLAFDMPAKGLKFPNSFQEKVAAALSIPLFLVGARPTRVLVCEAKDGGSEFSCADATGRVFQGANGITTNGDRSLGEISFGCPHAGTPTQPPGPSSLSSRSIQSIYQRSTRQAHHRHEAGRAG